jgi:sugar lactone lactonase YvrE
MRITLLLSVFALVVLFPALVSAQGQSVFTSRPPEPGAIHLTKDAFPVHGDGVADDADAIQQALDQAVTSTAKILFIPEGTYRLGRRLNVWSGTRVFGYGEKRPVFLLGEHTSGFQEGEEKYMVFFSGGRGPGSDLRRRGGGDNVPDGSPGTFYSAMGNIDFKIEAGNPAAIGIRFHVAQHCYLSHMNFELGTAKAGLEDIGNVVENLHFRGGRYGIITGRSAPGWPILAIDCSFDGQSVEAINCDESGLTLVRPVIRNVPTALAVVPEKPDEVWISDAQFENISGPAVVISNEHDNRTQINLEHVACKNVPVLAKFRESGETVEGAGTIYAVDHFTHGLHIRDRERQVKTTFTARSLDTLPARAVSDIPALPPVHAWVDVTTLGAVGDMETDNTAALRKAVAEHPVLYFPAGWYNVSDTITLRPDSVLVGLHPSATVVNLPNNSEAYQGKGEPKSVIEASAGGANIITGLGVYANALNPRAVAVKWMAGATSMVNDVRLHGGHGTRPPQRPEDGGERVRYSRRGMENREAWDTQPASLWVTDGGGGTLLNIWTPSHYSKSGLLITDTETGGRLYAMSAEHHVSNEVVIRDAANWEFYALQFEAEREEGPKDLPLEIDDAQDLLFANTFFYRVISSWVPFPYAVKVSDSSNIRFRNTHCYSNSRVSYDATIFAPDTGFVIRDSEHAAYDYTGSDSVTKTSRGGTPMEDARIERLATGFLNVAGAAVDSTGTFYFTDPRNHRIYRWSEDTRAVEVVREIEDRPVQVAFDRSGNLLTVAYEGNGNVCAFDPDEPHSNVVRLAARPATRRPEATPILAVSRWMSVPGFAQDSLARPAAHFVSPDGSVFLPAGEDFISGATMWGTKMADVLRSFRVAPARPGKPHYLCNEAELRTWAFDADADGTLSNPRLFAYEGGECVTVGPNENVYIGAGQILVFSPEGELIDTLRVPERPTSFVFGGEDGRTLYIAARTSIYSARIR